MSQTPDLTDQEQQTLACVAAVMIPANETHTVPSAGDPAIVADMVRTLGRDFANVRQALAGLGSDFASLGEDRREAAMQAFLAAGGTPATTLGRVVLQCYYRDDRVVRSLGLEPRPPFPKGHTLEQGDWSLLDPVRARPKMWRDAP